MKLTDLIWTSGIAYKDNNNRTFIVDNVLGGDLIEKDTGEPIGDIYSTREILHLDFELAYEEDYEYHVKVMHVISVQACNSIEAKIKAIEKLEKDCSGNINNKVILSANRIE